MSGHYSSAQGKTGFPLPPGLNDKLICFKTGNSGVMLNPIKAKNWVHDQTRAFNLTKPQTPLTLTNAHRCKCELESGGRLRTMRDTKTGSVHFEFELAAVTCSGAIRFLPAEPDIERQFNEALTAVCEANSREVAAVAGWQDGRLSRTLEGSFFKAANEAFRKLDLDKDCSKILQFPVCPTLIWRSQEFRRPSDNEANKQWLENLIEKRYSDKEHSDIFRSLGQELLLRLKTLAPLSNLSSAQRTLAVRQGIESGLLHTWLSNRRRWSTEPAGTLACHTEIDVIPVQEVPQERIPSQNTAYFFFQFSGSVIKHQVNGPSAPLFPDQPEWCVYEPLSTRPRDFTGC